MKTFFILLVMAVPESYDTPDKLNVMAVDHYETGEECGAAAAVLTYYLGRQTQFSRAMPHIACIPSDYDPRKTDPAPQ